jgi:hypothetical protein
VVFTSPSTSLPWYNPTNSFTWNINYLFNNTDIWKKEKKKNKE